MCVFTENAENNNELHFMDNVMRRKIFYSFSLEEANFFFHYKLQIIFLHGASFFLRKIFSFMFEQFEILQSLEISGLTSTIHRQRNIFELENFNLNEKSTTKLKEIVKINSSTIINFIAGTYFRQSINKSSSSSSF